MKFTFIIAILLVAGVASAATNTAASGSLADVTTAYNACAAGDTLQIPSGTNTWSSALTVAKAITIRGAGTNATQISSTVSANNPSVFLFKPGTNALARVTGIHFYQTNWTTGYQVTLVGSNKMFRVDNCKFTRGNHNIAYGLAGNGGSGPAFGVIDHNTFFNCNVSIFAEEAWSGDTNDGDGIWTLGTGGVYGPGTTNTMTIEDNVFLTDSEITVSANNNNQHLYGQSGARASFRYNYIRSTGTDEVGLIDGHGTYTAGWGRGTLLFEVYSNRFDIVKSYQPFDQRGGAWVFWGNTFTNGNSAYVALWNEHNTGDATGDGITNSFWWQNYRIYSGTTQEFAAISSTLPLNGTYPFSGAVNTNYWMHAPVSTNNFYPYTPLVYPHPLVTALDGGGDVIAPSVSITSPTNNQPSVATSISISGTSSDDTAIASVTLTNVSTATGFTVTGTTSWSATATLAYGSNYLRAIATDSSGNKATNAIAVLSVNDTNTWASTRSPYLGVQYLQTQNPAAQHTLMSNVPATYVNLPITYAILTGGVYGGYGNGTNYYDATYALNTNNGWRVILQFSDMPTNKILDYLPYLTNRYRCWMVNPINENDDATVSSETIKYYRAVMPNMRLGGPALYHLKNPTYIDALVASGAFAMLDSFVGHDYLACPLNGLCTAGWWTNSYYHPIDAPTDYHPEWSVGNLAARLAWMNTYTNLLRTNYTDTPKVMVTEYGIYQNNPEDGLYAGQIFRNMQIPAFVTANFATTNACPYNNALYDGVGVGYFTPSQQNFMKRIAPLSRGLGTITTDNLVIQ